MPLRSEEDAERVSSTFPLRLGVAISIQGELVSAGASGLGYFLTP